MKTIRHNNGTKLSVDNKKSATSSVYKSSNKAKSSNICYHFCDKNNHNTAEYREIVNFKQQKKACLEAKAGPGKSLWISISKKLILSKEGKTVEA
jgi:hypothetical protein